jgi:hypothetical protein
MSNDLDPLEQELAGLKPREPLPELRRRVERRLKREWRVIWVTAFVAGVVSGLIYLLFVWNNHVQHPWTNTSVQPALPNPVTVPDESLPTLHAYRRAISRSPEDFEALLDKYAAAGTETSTVHPFDRTEPVSFGEQ